MVSTYTSASNLVCGVMLFGARQHLAALEVVLFDAAQQHADVVAGLAFVQRLVERFDAGDDGVCGSA